jgi:hypothetical protein
MERPTKLKRKERLEFGLPHSKGKRRFGKGRILMTLLGLFNRLVKIHNELCCRPLL